MGTICVGHFPSENYVIYNRVYIGRRKRGLGTVKILEEGMGIIMFSSLSPVHFVKKWISLLDVSWLINIAG